MDFVFGDTLVGECWARTRWAERGVRFLSPPVPDGYRVECSLLTSPGGAFMLDTYVWPDAYRYRPDVAGD